MTEPNRRAEKYVEPSYQSSGFNCPHCGAFAHQTWGVGFAHMTQGGHVQVGGVFFSRCVKCSEWAIWVDEELTWPPQSLAPQAHEHMPSDVKADFDEARGIVQQSPRGAAALLRLSIQKLMPHLGEKGKDLN